MYKEYTFPKETPRAVNIGAEQCPLADWKSSPRMRTFFLEVVGKFNKDPCPGFRMITTSRILIPTILLMKPSCWTSSDIQGVTML